MWRVFGGVVLSIVLLTTGCTSGPKQKPVSIRSSNSQPMSFQGRETGQIDLINLIDPENRRELLPGQVCRPPKKLIFSEEERKRSYAKELSCATEAFQTYYMSYPEYENLVAGQGGNGNSNDEHYKSAVNSVALALRRNQIQDRIILRSDILCTDFRRRLGLRVRIGNDPTGLSNWMQNYASMVVSGVGSLFLNGDAVSVISNAARVGNVPGFIDDEEQLEAVIIQLSTDGLVLARSEKLEEINSRRFFRKEKDDPLTNPFSEKVFKPLLKKTSMEIGDGTPPGVTSTYREMQKTVGVVGIGSYTLEQALADVIDYHASCSVAVGLGRAAEHMHKEGEHKQKSLP